MFKVEDFQGYGKEHFEQYVASATSMQHGLQAIASAYGDYTKKSFEDTKSFVEKLSGVKSTPSRKTFCRELRDRFDLDATMRQGKNGKRFFRVSLD
jgi:hypothetical protein